MCLLIQGLTYAHPDHTPMFDQVTLELSKGDKATLIGCNGSGKSTLLKLIAGFYPTHFDGGIQADQPYYIPQNFDSFKGQTLASVLGIESKIKALNAILAGSDALSDFETLDDDWELESRVAAAFSYWKLPAFPLDTPFEQLSGGEQVKVFLSGLLIQQPNLILMDEPTNHLDAEGQQLLYDFIAKSAATILIVSHQRALLNKVEITLALEGKKILRYGGNYDFYLQEKQLQQQALQRDFEALDKERRLVKKQQQHLLEKQQKEASQNKKKAQRGDMPKIVLNTLKNKAERSSSKLEAVQEAKENHFKTLQSALREQLQSAQQFAIRIPNSQLARGKKMIAATSMNIAFNDVELWGNPLSFSVFSGDRIALSGCNGSGKTTVLELFQGIQKASEAMLWLREGMTTVYLDQQYQLLNPQLTVEEQLLSIPERTLSLHELRNMLFQYAVPPESWNKPIALLSGGERLKVALCYLLVAHPSIDLLLLDEPTNNIDLESIEILTATLKAYVGTLIVVSHDSVFLEHINCTRILNLSR